MTGTTSQIDEALDIASRLRKRLQKQKAVQIEGGDERLAMRSFGNTWFNKYRHSIDPSLFEDPSFQQVNSSFTVLLELAERRSSRVKCLNHLADLRSKLSQLRSVLLTQSAAAPRTRPAPDFSLLVSDTRMQEILQRRWDETQICLNSSAHLAATVMMGGLLEALILARINSVSVGSSTLAPVFKAKSAPRDKAGKTLPLKDWVLRDYIDVAHELKWIGKSAKDVGVVLRDYRNFIHPQKEFSYGMVIDKKETDVLWPVFESLTKQILESITMTP